MVDLNHVFLFLALVTPVAVLVSNSRSRAGSGGWRVAAIVVLGVTGVAWMVARDQAGFIGAGAWFALLFLPAIGLKRMSELAAHRHYRSARRLATLLQWLHPTTDLRAQIQMFREMEMEQFAGSLPPPVILDEAARRDRRRLRRAPAVTALIVANILVFAVENVVSSTNPSYPDVLLRLGAVQPVLVLLGHQYWRLVAALFLHAGVMHLLFNLFALYVLGPPFERAIGSLRFLICYLLAGICSTTGVVLLWRFGVVQDAEVVGASGCVMGIVGAWAALLIRHHQTPQIRQRLMNIVLIVVVQTIFDWLTPQVSMAAHLCGLIGGFLVGLAVASGNPKRDLEQRPSYG